MTTPLNPNAPEDAFEERDQRFVEGQGISLLDYSEMLDLANAHAEATPLATGARKWRFVGPRNVGGRIVSLGQDPIDPRVIYAGAAQGGLWRSIDAGDTWSRVGNESHTFPVGAIAVPPTQSSVVYFGTGSHTAEQVSGRGLFRASIDRSTGVANVERLAAPPHPDITPVKARAGSALRYTRIRVDPDEPTRFWIASQTGLWRCECPLAEPAAPSTIREFPDQDNKPDVAALREQPLAINGLWPSYCTDLLVAHDPRDTETIEVLGVEKRRYLVLFVAIQSVGVFRGRFDRDNPGHRVEFESTPLDMSTGALNFGRISLAQCERQPEHVFAMMEDTGTRTVSEVYHSANTGDSWTKGSQRMDAAGASIVQAGYNHVLEVAPDNPKIVVCGAVDLCLSDDFGSTWKRILDRTRYDSGGDKAQHADQHIAMFDLGDHRRLWVGNDGGLSMARDLRMPPQALGYWRKRSHGIYAGMCQDVSINPSLPFMCAVGFHDNGTYLSIGGPTWYHISGGDGGACAFNLPSPRQVFVGWQGDSSTGEGLVQVDAVAFDSPTPPLPAVPAGLHHDELVTFAAHDVPETVARGHGVRYRWTTALALAASGVPLTSPALFVGVVEQHPTVAGMLLLGRVNDGFASRNAGASWAPLMAAPVAPAVGAVAHVVSAMTFGHAEPHSPTPAQVDGWAGTSSGALFFTNDAPIPAPPAASNWRAVAALPFPGAPLMISEIAVNPLDRRIVAVSATGLQGRVFVTYDQGTSWFDVTEPAPNSLNVTPAAVSIQEGENRRLSAVASYPGGVSANVTARAAWSSNPLAQASVQTASGGAIPSGAGFQGFTSFGTEGVVTGGTRSPPPAVITATLLGNNTPNGSATSTVTVTPGPAPAATLPDAPPRDVVPGSLPPGPTSSVIFDPSVVAGSPLRLFAGTLVGVYALSIPQINFLLIEPQPGPLTFQTGSPVVQLRCIATLANGTRIDVTRSVDWSSTTGGHATVSNAASHEGEVTIGTAGSDTITATRGGVAPVTLVINVQPAAAPAPPAIVPLAVPARPAVEWQRFNNGLPQILVTDFERVGTTRFIRAATFGMGVFECDLTTGVPPQYLHIRQTIIEDGRAYPRTPPLVPDDPRFPAGVLAIDFTHAYDIRLDAPPYSFFDDVVDGVEFDEQLQVADAVPTEVNYVYVQVHNSGPDALPSVSVHLYAAECAATDVINPIGAAPTVTPASLDASAPISDFYGQPNRDPLLTSRWTRVDVVRLLDEVPADGPRVVRFTWVPDASLENKNVALLALCEANPLSGDTPLTPAPAGATLSAFILAERRAALRVVHVAARPVASLFVRDGIADDTRVGGYPAGGRSPDIMVVHPTDITGTPEDAFKDHIARRATDSISHTGTTFIYVRVHNRRRFTTTAQVKVFVIPLDENNEPSHTTATWTELPSAAAFADAPVPPLGVAYARVELPGPDDPNPTGTNKTYLILALIRSTDNTDPLPNKDRVDSADAFWSLVQRFADADNAAARAVPWVP